MIHSFGRITGAGVRIALIDSGVNPRHPHVGSVAGGVAFSLTEDGDLLSTADSIDRWGHGTALAGILRAIAPQADLYAVKIFRDPRTPTDTLTASLAVLEAGLRWAIQHRMHLINLSLGTTNPDYRDRLSTLVAQARESGALLVASSAPGRTNTLPAALPGVIGVAGDDAYAWGEYGYAPDDPIPFRAHPWPRPIPNLPQARNFHGHSCASAHVAAALALLWETYGPLTLNDAVTHLRKVTK